MLSWDDFDDKEKMKEPVLAKKNLDEEKKNQVSEPRVEKVLKEKSMLSDLDSLDLEAGRAELEGASARVDGSEKKMII